MINKPRLDEFEKIIGYHFKNRNLLLQALSHTSYANERGKDHLESNERLEFLGDAVLEIVTSEKLFFKYSEKREGELSKMRANLVCEPALELFSRNIRLSEFILLGRGEEKTGGRSRASIISDCMEALIGAIYLDSGFAAATEFIEKFILYDIDNSKIFKDNKTALQELLQAGGDVPVYKLISENGPAHAREFTVSVGNRYGELGQGTATSKKAAEQEAAGEALKNLRE